jgi:hypothetical protein
VVGQEASVYIARPTGHFHVGCPELGWPGRDDPSQTRIPGVLLAILAIGVAVRFLAASNDLWLDEIWTLLHLRAIGSPWDVFTEIRHDNNHFLNSLYLYFMGGAESPVVLRLFSVLTGGLSLLLTWRIGRRRNGLQGVLFTTLVTFSFLMVLYSSEARGYAPMILGVLICFDAFECWLKTRSRLALASLWFGCLFGFMAHFSFVQFFLALAVWLVTGPETKEGRGALVRRSVVVLGPPALLLLATYLFHIRHMPPGTGPRYPAPVVLVDAISLAGGGPALSQASLDVFPVALSISYFLAMLTILELWRLFRVGHPLRFFYLTVLVAVPAIFLVVLQPQVIFIRYVLVTILFWYLLMAGALDRISSRGRMGSGLVAVGMALFLLGNGLHLADLLRYGRGQYREALSMIAAETHGAVVEIGSDYDFRARALIDYHWPRVAPAVTVDVVPRDDVMRRQPEWYLAHRLDKRDLPPGELQIGPAAYELLGGFSSASQSGWAWFVYRRQ